MARFKVLAAATAAAIVGTAGIAEVSAARQANLDASLCRPNESGPALLAEVSGFRDRRGRVRLELYPPVDGEFLGNSRLLIEAGKDFRRIDEAVPPSGRVTLCVRAPHTGEYAVSAIHDRDSSGKFAPMSDGAGFGNNPRVGLSKPRAAVATMTIGPGVTQTRIVLNYFHGFTFSPLKDR